MSKKETKEKQKKIKIISKLSMALMYLVLIISVLLFADTKKATIKTGLIGENVEAEYNDQTATLTIRSINGVKGTIDRDMWADFMHTKVKVWNGNHMDDYSCNHKILTFENPVYAPEDSSYLLAGEHSSVNKLWGLASHFYLETINNIENLDTSRVTNMKAMFYGTKIPNIDITMWDTSKVTNMSQMFAEYNARYTQTLKSVNISGINTSKVTDMSSMFENRRGIENVNLLNIDVSKVKDFSYMFKETAGLTSIDLSSFVTSSAENMEFMFHNSIYLETINLSNFDTSNVTKMYYMFANLYFLKEMDISHFDTSKVTTMGSMFVNCRRLKEIVGIENLKTGELKTVGSMFSGCYGLLGDMDLSNWNGSKITSINYMFNNCKNLKSIVLFSSNAIEYGSNVVENCSNLESVDFRNICIAAEKSIYYKDVINACPKLRDIYTPYTTGESSHTRNMNLPDGYIFINADSTDTNIYSGIIDLKNVKSSMHLVRGNLITLETNGGVVNSGDVNKYKWGEEVNLPTDVTKDGYSFDGWYLEEDFSGEKQTKVLSTDTGAKKYYAKWNLVDYTIDYDTKGGSLTGQKTSYTIEDNDFSVPMPTKAEHVFMGWTGDNITNPIRNLVITKGNFGNKSFVATWAKKIELDKTTITDRFKTSLSGILANTPVNYTVATDEGILINGIVTADMVTGYDINSQDDSQTLTVTVKDEDALSPSFGQEWITTLTLNLIDYVEDIEITKPTKLIYKIGESLELAGGYVKPIMASGKDASQIEMTDSRVTVTGFDSTTEGAKNISVKYGEITKTFGISVTDLVTDIEFDSLPTKTDYKYDDALDVTGGRLKVTKESGAEEIIDIVPGMITGFDGRTLGSQTLSINYDGKTLDYIVNVEDYITGIEVKAPTKTTYQKGQVMDVTGGRIVLLKASGAREEITLTEAMTSGFNSNSEGSQDVGVSYKGFTGAFNIKVVASTNNGGSGNGNGGSGNGGSGTGGNGGAGGSGNNGNNGGGNNGGNNGNELENTDTYNSNIDEFDANIEDMNLLDDSLLTTGENSSNTEEKPTAVLGLRTVKYTNNLNDLKEFFKNNLFSIIGIGAVGLFLIIGLIVILKKNVKVYIKNNEEIVKTIKCRVTKNNPYIDLDEHLDNVEEGLKITVELSKGISKKLDEEAIIIRLNGKNTRHIVKYKDDSFEIEL